MLTTKQLLQQMELQDTLNKLIHPEWTQQGFRWHVAAMMEAAELLDHIGWKWWKATPEPNVEQIQLELVDIWHFALSAMLDEHRGDTVFAAANMKSALGRLPTTCAPDWVAKTAILGFIGCCANEGTIDLGHLARLMHHYNITHRNLHLMYVGKNVLNIFRQRHGYQDGTYVKTWHGREDNEVLAEMMDQYPDAAPDELLFMLEHTYSTLNANPNQLELNLPCVST